MSHSTFITSISANMEKPTTTTSTTIRHVLFDLSPIDIEMDELEDKTRRCYQTLKRVVHGQSPCTMSTKERHETYAKYIATNPQLNIDELTMGLLVAILVEDEGQADYFNDVVAFSRDSLNLFVTHLNLIVVERISRLSNHSIKQIFWITKQMIKANVPTVESTCSNLIRQTAKGDLSARNIFMAENLLELFCDNRAWLINSNNFTGPTVIYNTMRLIIDHAGPAHKSLRERETELVIDLIREKFETLVRPIGRDFLRLLENLTGIPEFQKLKHDIYVNQPQRLGPKYDGPHRILAQRTPRRLFQSCLTFDMERKIAFLACQVNFGNQKRYQDWFSKQFFSGTESTLLRCDLIRYVCTIIHPSNEVLCSNIMPRWAIIGWLLTTSLNVVASCRLALFFDWFAYDPNDNIMNIEPAALLMCHSVRSHPQVSANLVEFLCRAPTIFHPKISSQIKTGIRRSLQQILEKRVLQSLKPIFSYPKYDPTLKMLIKENFPEHYQIDNGVTPRVELIPPAARSTTGGVPTIQSPTSGVTPPLTSVPNQTTGWGTESPNQQLERKQPELVILDDDSNNIQQAEVIKTKTLLLDPAPLNNLAHNNHHHNDASANNHQLTTEQIHSKSQAPVIRTWAGGDPDQMDHVEVIPTESKPSQAITSPRRNSLVSDTNKVNRNPVPAPNMSSGRETMSTSEDENFRNLMSKKQNMGMYYLRNDVKMTDPQTEHLTRVQFPFMEVSRPYPSDALGSFDRAISAPLRDIANTDLPDYERCSFMASLLKSIKELKDFDTQTIEILGDCLANAFALDFTTRIYPSNDETSDLHETLNKPFFNLCNDAYSSKGAAGRADDIPISLALLAYVGTIFKATGFLVIYFLKVESTNSVKPRSPINDYLKFYELRSSPNDQKATQHWQEDKFAMKNHFEEDLRMMFEYDPEMFSYVLPTIFSEFTPKFDVTNNARLIRLAVSAMGPLNLSELVSYCMTGTTKVVHRDNTVQRVIKESLNWPSWEQYCFWKIISAHSVPIECYLPLLVNLNAKEHPEAITSILLNVQKIHEPNAHIIESVIAAFGLGKEQSIASLIRHWALKTDVRELVKNIISILDPPPVKRKGQSKPPVKALSPICLKALGALDLIRSKAPKNKIFVQLDLWEGLVHIEQLCDETNRKRFSKLFEMQPKQMKKKKLDT